jgi:hypothetical protein
MRTIRDQRGSTVLISLVLIFIMTILGLALFDLGTVESRLVYTSQTDARVFEIAQAGVQRALQKLVERKNAVLPNGESWATGANVYCTGGTASQHGCSETQFRPADPSFISNLGFDGGTYAIELMQVKPGSPSVPPLSVPCNKDANNICNDLMFVRATGTLTNTPAGYSRTRTIQVLAQPSTNAIFGRGLTGATATGLPINGSVKIAGSIFVTGIDGTGSLQLGGGAGQRNSWAELDATSLSRLAMLPLVCPVGRTCSGPSDLVESLGATLKVIAAKITH